jgi:hypothetical protein
MSELTRQLRSVLICGSIVVCVLVFVGALVMPNFVRSGPGKTTGIEWRLRLIDTAKQEWAADHHQTNDVVMTTEDIAPYLTHFFPQGMIRPVAGERYMINTLWKAPEAELTRELEGRAKGTLIRVDDYILPNPQGGANRRQASSSQTNRTSEPAASRSSPQL